MRPLPSLLLLALLALVAPAPAALAQEAVFSGPQVGEKITRFRALEVVGPQAGKERDYVTEFAGAPATIVFLHGLERSLLPLLRTVDAYGAERREQMRTVVVFLSEDRVGSEQRLPLVARSVRMQVPLALSLDGAEGPGNYGLNKKCLMTVVVAKGDRVTANFALVQPGIADAPKLLAAMASASGDPKPPSAEALQEKLNAGARRDAPAARAAAPRDRAAADAARFDLSSPEGLRDAVRSLLAEVQALRREVTALRGGKTDDARPAAPARELPGAAPTDPQLLTLLRRFIQPTNDNATVDRVIQEVEAYVKDSAPLKKQAVDGWVRVLFLKYGTEYAQKAGQPLVERLRR